MNKEIKCKLMADASIAEQGGLVEAVDECVRKHVSGLVKYGVYFTAKELVNSLSFYRRGDNIKAILAINIAEVEYHNRCNIRQAERTKDGITENLRTETRFANEVAEEAYGLAERACSPFFYTDKAEIPSVNQVFNMHRPSIVFMYKSVDYYERKFATRFILAVCISIVCISIVCIGNLVATTIAFVVLLICLNAGLFEKMVKNYHKYGSMLN